MRKADPTFTTDPRGVAQGRDFILPWLIAAFVCGVTYCIATSLVFMVLSSVAGLAASGSALIASKKKTFGFYASLVFVVIFAGILIWAATMWLIGYFSL